MENRNQQKNDQTEPQNKISNEDPTNPFENGQTSDQDIKQNESELDREQQFKEAQTERD